MQTRFQTFNMEHDRSNSKKAEKLFRLLWPHRKARVACAARLVKSIRCAHQHGPASWGVTMHNWCVRLNVGQVLVLQVASDEFLAYKYSPRGRSVYKAIPNAKNFYGNPAQIGTGLRRDWKAHEQLIGLAAKAKKVSPWKKSFSEGVLKHLEALLGAELPRPTYLKSSMHILQGGIENGDKKWLEKAASRRLRARSWIAPKSVQVGDDAVIYLPGQGFFATARIDSEAKPRADWQNRYGAALNQIRLIIPPISLEVIRKRIPNLKWANYPRGIVTLTREMAIEVEDLIRRRRKTGLPDLDSADFADLSLAEHRRLALASSRQSPKLAKRMATYRQRSRCIHRYVLLRADGNCEGCSLKAPFQKANGEPYLEPHHTLHLARDDGPDDPRTVIALCPTCHKRVHHAHDGDRYNRSLRSKLKRIERPYQ